MPISQCSKRHNSYSSLTLLLPLSKSSLFPVSVDKGRFRSEVESKTYLVQPLDACRGAEGGHEVDKELPCDAAGDDVAPDRGQEGVAQPKPQLEAAEEIGVFGIITSVAKARHVAPEVEHRCETDAEVVGEYSDPFILRTIL